MPYIFNHSKLDINIALTVSNITPFTHEQRKNVQFVIDKRHKTLTVYNKVDNTAYFTFGIAINGALYLDTPISAGHSVTQIINNIDTIQLSIINFYLRCELGIASELDFKDFIEQQLLFYKGYSEVSYLLNHKDVSFNEDGLAMIGGVVIDPDQTWVYNDKVNLYREIAKVLDVDLIQVTQMVNCLRYANLIRFFETNEISLRDKAVILLGLTEQLIWADANGIIIMVDDNTPLCELAETPYVRYITASEYAERSENTLICSGIFLMNQSVKRKKYKQCINFNGDPNEEF